MVRTVLVLTLACLVAAGCTRGRRVQVPGSERDVWVKKGRDGSVTTVAIVSLLDGQSIEGQWRTERGKNMTLKQRTLVVTRHD